MKVNESDWASDLGRGRYAGWTALTDPQNVGTDAQAPAPEQTVHEVGEPVREPDRPAARPSGGRRRSPARGTNR